MFSKLGMKKRELAFGLLIGFFALFLATNLNVQHALPSFANSFSFSDLEMPDFSLLPAGVASVLQQHLSLQYLPAINFSFAVPFSSEASPEDPGVIAYNKGYRAHHPIFIIPGFTTTGAYPPSSYRPAWHLSPSTTHPAGSSSSSSPNPNPNLQTLNPNPKPEPLSPNRATRPQV
jgi:hypothetical protein